MKIYLKSVKILKMNEYIAKLNPEQLQAATATDGAVLVLAGAGSGKTRVLTSRIAYILEQDLCYPSQILAITFTNKAANEMRARLSEMVGEDVNAMWISTIHSMCLRILRANIQRLDGYKNNFTVYSEVDTDRVIKRIITEMNLEGDKIFKNAKYHISHAKTNDISPDRYAVEGVGNDVKMYCKIYREYEEVLKKSNAMDYDDLLLKTYHLLDEDEEVCNYYAQKFHYIHIDEFQDTNVIQYKIAKLLSSVHGNIFVVGDDDQSIYSWRGAEIRNILDFNKDYKDAKVFKLQQNYRSTKKILKLANAVIKNNSERSPKSLWTENPDGVKIEYFCGDEEANEAAYVSRQISALVSRGAKYSDFAVLMRVNALSRSFEQQFGRQRIPFKVFGGFKFFERKEIKDLTAYLRFIVNPLDNDAILRIINTPKRGIGDKTINELIRYCTEKNISLFDGLCENDWLDLSASAKMRLELFKQLLFKLALLNDSMTLDKLVNQVIEDTNFLSQFVDNTEENLSRRMNVDEFKNSVYEFCRFNKEATLDEYLGSIALYSDIDEADSSDYVSVATIHAVKGLEFKTVFIVGLDENIFPISRAVGSPADMEEERRLMYVAITRAENRLYLTRANSRYLYGERQLTSRSRFLNEVSDKLGLDERDAKAMRPRDSELDYQYSGFARFSGRQQSSRYQRDKTEEDYGYRSDEPAEYHYTTSTGNFAKTFMNSSTTAKRQNTGKNHAQYYQGRKVVHKKFGVGTIILVKNNGANLVIDVAFNGVGVKSLAVDYAPIELL